jgi:hypothetical protein
LVQRFILGVYGYTTVTEVVSVFVHFRAPFNGSERMCVSATWQEIEESNFKFAQSIKHSLLLEI